jgi:hypothetical protein
MQIVIKTIPQSEHRYDTVGDYWEDENGVIQVRVSRLPDKRYEQAIILHELFEFFMMMHTGVKEPDVMAFDVEFEKNRTNDHDEPGDDLRAPYRREHCFATAVERMFIAAVEVDWATYDKACSDLFA